MGFRVSAFGICRSFGPWDECNGFTCFVFVSVHLSSVFIRGLQHTVVQGGGLNLNSFNLYVLVAVAISQPLSATKSQLADLAWKR